MGKTPYSEGFIVSNAASAIINATIKKAGASLLTPLHISGEENAMTDITSRLFGSNISWFCKNDTYLLKNFNKTFPFSKPVLLDRLQPFQHSEYEGYFSAADAAFRNERVASTQKVRKKCWKIGVPLSDLWEWSLVYRMPRTSSKFGASQASQLAYARAAMVEGEKLKLEQSLGRSQQLAGQKLWPMKATSQRLKAKEL